MAEEDEPLEEEDDADIGEDDDLRDFIVDEDIDDHGQPLR